MLLFLSTNMPAMTSYANHQLTDDILTASVIFSCYDFRFCLLAFDKSVISGPIFDDFGGNN